MPSGDQRFNGIPVSGETSVDWPQPRGSKRACGCAPTQGHNAEWFATIKARTGSVPTIRYFDLTMIVDNETGSVTEFPLAAAQAAE